jgi:parallel beta-helix repeat protein
VANTIDTRPGRLDLHAVVGDDFAITLNFTGFSLSGETLTGEVFNRAATSVGTFTLTNIDSDTATMTMADVALSPGPYRWSLRATVADKTLVAGDFLVSLGSGDTNNASTSSATITVTSGTATVSVALGAVGYGGFNVKSYGATGDGTTDDGAAIMAANTAATATKGVVFFPPGTYRVSAFALRPAAGTTWAGSGEASIIKLKNAGNGNLIEVMPGITDVTIRDLRLDGNRANQSSDGNCVKTNAARTKVLNCHVLSAYGYNIVAFAGGDDFSVIGCTTEDALSEGIEIQGASRAVISNNIVKTAGKNGIYVWANGGTCSDVSITGNVVYDSSNLTASFAGIRVDDGATNVTITGNTVTGGGTTSPGIKVFSSTAARVTHVTVSGNTIDAPTANGIFIDVADYVTVTGNTVKNAAAVGILVQSSTTACRVSNNVVSGTTSNDSGIKSNSGTSIAIVSNVVQGTSAGYGIRIQGGSKVTVVGNSALSNALAGIVLSGVTSWTVDGNISSANTQRGIEITGCTAGTVSNNSVTTNGTAYDGITVYGSSAGVTLTGNNVTNSGLNGIRVQDASNCVISSNVCRNNGINGTVALAAGIQLAVSAGAVANIAVNGNRCYDDQTPKTQLYGLQVVGACDSLIIGPNVLTGNSTAASLIASTATNVTETGAPLSRRFKSGLYYTHDVSGSDGTVVQVLNQLSVNSFTVDATTSFDRISLEVTANVATAVHRLGIYADNGNGYPGALVLDAGTIDAATSTGIKEITIALSLTPGLYWLGAVPQTAVATVRSRGAINPLVGQSTGNNANVTHYTQTSVTGALPSTFTTTAAPVQSSYPKVMLRAL